MNNLIECDFVGSAESEEVKARTNHLFANGLLKYDLLTGKFIWDEEVNKSFDLSLN